MPWIKSHFNGMALVVILAALLTMPLASVRFADAGDAPHSIFDDQSLLPSTPPKTDAPPTPAPGKNDAPPPAPPAPAIPAPPPVRNDGPPLVVPPGGFDWAAYVNNAAAIEMAVYKPIALVEGNNEQNWEQAPEGIKRFPMVLFADFGAEKGVADFKVTRGGLLMLACDYSYQGNKSGNWTQTRLKREDFVARGWTYLSPEQMGGALGLRYYDKRRHDYDVFVKTVKEGEFFNLRCNKYFPPFVILPASRVPAGIAIKTNDPKDVAANPGEIPAGPAPGCKSNAAPAPVAGPVAPPPMPAVRRAIPSPEDIARSRTLLNNVFAEQMKDQTSTGRKKLAMRLLDEVPKTADNPSDQFVILIGAIGAAREAADLPLCFAAVDVMSSQYLVDGFKAKTDAVVKVGVHGDSPATTAENVRAALELIDPLLADDDFQTCTKILSLARASAATERTLQSAIQTRAAAVAAARATHERLTPFIEKLKTAPDDPAANLAVGRHICFTKADWKKGLPMLARSSDAVLKPLAALELSAPAKPEDVMRLADGWWDVGAKEPGDSRIEIHQHAAALYSSARGSAMGLRQALIDHRLTEAAAERPPVKQTEVRQSNSVDLFALLDTNRGAVTGNWTLKDDMLTFANHESPHIQFPYRPPTEYDMHVRFTPESPITQIVMILSSHDKQFDFRMNENTTLGFDQIGAKPFTQNPTGIRMKTRFSSGKTYEAVVKVRANGVEAYLNDQPVTSWKTDYKDMSIWDGWKLKDRASIGVGAYRGAAKFLSVTVTEVSGRGEITADRRADH